MEILKTYSVCRPSKWEDLKRAVLPRGFAETVPHSGVLSVRRRRRPVVNSLSLGVSLFLVNLVVKDLLGRVLRSN
jgi:hypothetical protein